MINTFMDCPYFAGDNDEHPCRHDKGYWNPCERNCIPEYESCPMGFQR